jgi:hypothetical protein
LEVLVADRYRSWHASKRVFLVVLQVLEALEVLQGSASLEVLTAASWVESAQHIRRVLGL